MAYQRTGQRGQAGHDGRRRLLHAAVGALGTIFYGALIGNGTDRTGLTIGYLIGGGVMIIGGLAEVFLGIEAESKPLERVAPPLTEVTSEA